jgi:AGZA family xanthine/uracil permease-like MFS transporter
MFNTVTGVDFARVEDGLPAFVTLVLIPLTFSITQGIPWGFVLHALIDTITGRGRDVPLTLWMLAAVSALLLVLES